MLDLLISILDSLFDLIGDTMVFVIGGTVALGFLVGIPFGIYLTIRDMIYGKKNHKKEKNKLKQSKKTTNK